jgi:phosphoribosyl 1,2-cyclic phosphodiesterase
MTSSITQTEAPDEGDGKLPVPVAECPNCGDTVKGLDEINTTCFECGLGVYGSVAFGTWRHCPRC